MHRTPLYSLQTHCISYACVGTLSLHAVLLSLGPFAVRNSFYFKFVYSFFISLSFSHNTAPPLACHHYYNYILLYVFVFSFYCHVVLVVGHITTASAAPHVCTTGSCTKTSPLPLFVFFPGTYARA